MLLLFTYTVGAKTGSCIIFTVQILCNIYLCTVCQKPMILVNTGLNICKCPYPSQKNPRISTWARKLSYIYINTVDHIYTKHQYIKFGLHKSCFSHSHKNYYICDQHFCKGIMLRFVFVLIFTSKVRIIITILIKIITLVVTILENFLFFLKMP